MTNSPQSLSASLGCKEVVCIDCNRVLDSCRDKDCFENVEVFLTDFGEEVINNATSVRVKCASLLHTDIYTECVQFNRGFYQITVRFFVKITAEACVSIGRSQEIEGIAVCEKKVVLYGSVGNVKIFKSDAENSFCSTCHEGKHSTNCPTVVVEAVDPIALSASVKETGGAVCCCCCSVDDVPSSVCASIGGTLCPRTTDKVFLVTLGFFSVIRIERPAQYLVQATEYSVPDKECVVTDENNPCAVFNRMAFPVNEFYPPSYRGKNCNPDK